MENANILTLFWASFLYTPPSSYSSSSTFSTNLALFRPTSGRGLALYFFRLRVFHTAVQFGKRHVQRHVKLIETSAEERDINLRAQFRKIVFFVTVWTSFGMKHAQFY
jgi:hypothetical protein